MRMFRFPISTLMLLVVPVAVGFGALKNPSESMAGIVFTLTVGVLLFATVGAVARQGKARLPWLGFSMFGLGYLVFGFLSGAIPTYDDLPTIVILDKLNGVIHREQGTKFGRFSNGTVTRVLFDQIGHSLFALVSGLLGSVLARFFATKPTGGGQEV